MSFKPPPPAQPQPLGHEPIHLLTHSLRRIEMELTASNLPNKVHNYSGESHKQFKLWLRDMDRVGDHVRHDPERMKRLTIDTLKGHAGEFFHRFLRNRPSPTWEEIREVLKEKYYDQVDLEYSKKQLKCIKQHSGKSVQTYGDRLNELADQVYSDAEMQQPHINSALKDRYIEGLKDEHIVRQLIKRRPNTIQEAIDIATRASQTNRLFNLMRSSEEEPMDISAVNSQSSQPVRPSTAVAPGPIRSDEAQALNDKVDRMWTEINAVVQSLTNRSPLDDRPRQYDYPREASQYRTAYRNTQPKQHNRNGRGPPIYEKPAVPQVSMGDKPRGQRSPQYSWTEDGRAICAHCGIAGHVRRVCRKRQAQSPLNSQ